MTDLREKLTTKLNTFIFRLNFGLYSRSSIGYLQFRNAWYWIKINFGDGLGNASKHSMKILTFTRNKLVYIHPKASSHFPFHVLKLSFEPLLNINIFKESLLNLPSEFSTLHLTTGQRFQKTCFQTWEKLREKIDTIRQ